MIENYTGLYECVRVKRDTERSGQWMSLFKEVKPDTGETITLYGGMLEEERPKFEEGKRYRFNIDVSDAL